MLGLIIHVMTKDMEKIVIIIIVELRTIFMLIEVDFYIMSFVTNGIMVSVLMAVDVKDGMSASHVLQKGSWVSRTSPHLMILHL